MIHLHRDKTWDRVLAVLVACVIAVANSPVAAQRTNVLLVTVDTFRPDHLGAYGYDRDTSPALDKLASEGAVFEQTIASSSWTTPGLISVLTGQWAPSHGVDARGKTLRAGTPTFATELAKAGYAVPDILYLSSIPNLQNLGLTNSYVDRDKYLPSGDEVLFQALEAYQDSTFFIYYHYRNLHLPINPSEPYDQIFVSPDYDRGFVRERVATVRENVTIPIGSVTFAPEDSVWIRGLYDGQIREMDETFIAPLVSRLKKLDLYDNTLVIITADHGEELLEHGFIGHPSTSFKGIAYDELIRIPLIMTCPNLIPSGVRMPGQVQNVDILPTALDLLGLPIPEHVQGRSLVPVFQDKAIEQIPAFTETTQGGYQSTPEMEKVRVRANRAPPWKLIHTLGPGIDRTELYNLDVDPNEMEDVSGKHPDRADRMRKELHAWLLNVRIPPDAEPVATGPVHRGDIRVRFPDDGDTLRYVDADMTVDIQWEGTAKANYTIEYWVGEGNYHLEGRLTVEGLVSKHGPFTEEMWNMLTLYNPFSFRVVANGSSAKSEWVSFVIDPSGVVKPPSAADLVIAKAVWASMEMSILMSGLGALLVVGMEFLISHQMSDLLGWGLILVLLLASVLPPVIRRVGRERTKLWGIVALYSLAIYATLSVAPRFWGTAFRLTNGRIDYAVPLIGVFVAIWVVARIMSHRLGIGSILGASLIAGLYVYLLVWLSTSPAERFHLAEYGLLSFMTFKAWRLDYEHRTAVLLGLLTASLIGTGDEFIQWALPTRVFEWKDVGLNVLSSFVGMALMLVLRSGDHKRVEG